MASDGVEMELDPSALGAPPTTVIPAPPVNDPHEPLAQFENLTLGQQPREGFREMRVKVHIRHTGRDAWTYLGRAFVTQEFTGHNSRVVIRAAVSGKTLAVFSEATDLQAEKRGNFVVVSCVEGSGVVSWSLNAMNNSETLKLMASVELACYRCRQARSDPMHHSKQRRRIERVIKDDRRRRHKRRREEDAMVEAFQNQNLN